MSASGTSIRMPKRYSISEDFDLWMTMFESRCRAAKVADASKCDVLLAALDDDAFKAVNSLALSTEVQADYTQLKAAMKDRFALTTSPFEQWFNLRRCRQKDGETFDNYANELSRLAVKAYPDLIAKTRQEVVRDQFIEGLQDDYIQERLLQEAPEYVEEALKLAKQLGAAKAAQRSLKESLQPASSTSINNISDGFNLQQEIRRGVQEVLDVYLPSQNPISTDKADAAVGAVTSDNYKQPRFSPRNPIRRSQGNTKPPIICWSRKRPGHIRARCPNKTAETCPGCGGRGHTREECLTWLRQTRRNDGAHIQQLCQAIPLSITYILVLLLNCRLGEKK